MADMTHLIGRPLVPYFDQVDGNVNTKIDLPLNQPHEQIHVDARQWNKEKGYFEYPSEAATERNQDALTSSSPARKLVSPQRKPLLTPSMLTSTSQCKTQKNARTKIERDFPAQNTEKEDETANRISRNPSPVNSKEGKQDRTKQSPKSKNKKNKASNKGKDNQTSPGSTKNKRSHNGGSTSKKSNGNKNQASGNHTKTQCKSKPGATQKWAWSAFQSSPDPEKLPLPPFLISTIGEKCAKEGGKNSLDYSVDNLDPGPSRIPNKSTNPPQPAPGDATTREQSMTQDLRKMLNIGI